jgi:molybdopterin-dependent oxidoreductase alpha subunit
MHRIEPSWTERVLRLVPFGLGQTKPHHYRDMARVAWRNRDSLGYAWKVLTRGVCDGCALGVAGFRDWTIEGVHLCMTRLNLLRLNTMPAMTAEALSDLSRIRGAHNEQLRDLGRLAHPMLRRKGEAGFRRVSWEEAQARIVDRLRVVAPRRVAFYLTSRALTNETYYVAQKLARFLGTNNVDNAARLCHSPSTGAMKDSLGVAASTCSYRDWYGTDLLLFFGSNPANDQPVSIKYIHEAKRRGTKVVVINPYREPGMHRYWIPSTPSSATFGTDVMDYWFGVSAGGDVAFLYGVMKVLIRNGWYDAAFVRDHTTGFEELRVSADAQDWSTLETRAGLPRRSMEEFAALIRDAKTAVLVWSMGITQHAFGAHAVQMIINLGLLKGFVGRERCGLMPIRGHSGVQGGAEMGAYATAFPGGKPITHETAAALAEQYGFAVPGQPGLTAPEMVEAAARGELDVLYCIGGNFLRALPDPDYVAAAIARIPLRVYQDIIVTDQMLIDPAGEVVLLPAKTRYEQDDGGTETTSERRVVFSPEIPRQLGEARAEWRILRDLALAVDRQRAAGFACESGWAVREEIGRCVPFYSGIERLRRGGDEFQYGGPQLCSDWRFPTPDGKARVRAVPLPPEQKQKGSYFVTTRRGKQFNTMIYGEVDPLTGAPRDAIFFNPDDAAELHLANGDRVTLVNEQGRLTGRVYFAPIVRGDLQVHWPEGNVLIRRGVTDSAGGVPDYNAEVRVEREAP